MSLTDIEAQALRLRHNLADGHARHSLRHRTRSRLAEAMSETMVGRQLSYPFVARRFLNAMGGATATDLGNDAFISYSASVSIDIVAKWLAREKTTVWLATPTFDNLAALLKSNALDLRALPEEAIFDGSWMTSVDSGSCLFLVNPTNPTGKALRQEQLRSLIAAAGGRDITVVLDMSFRLFEPELCVDWVAEARQTGCRLVIIDDTGKVFPAHDCKVGVLTCTPDLSQTFGDLHNDLLLNVSALDLLVLSEILIDNRELDNARNVVASNRRSLDHRFGAHRRDEGHASVGWLDFGEKATRLLKVCEERGVGMLPGQQFYWEAAPCQRPTGMVRVALARDHDYFESALELIFNEWRRL